MLKNTMLLVYNLGVSGYFGAKISDKKNCQNSQQF